LERKKAVCRGKVGEKKTTWGQRGKKGGEKTVNEVIVWT